MVAEELCSISDAAAADNCFAADSCSAVSAAAGVAGDSDIVDGGAGDGGEGPHPPRSTYQTVNTYLL